MKPLFIALLICFAEYSSAQIITTPPQHSHLRSMAEWEEVQALTIAWTDFPAILKQIVAAARLETQVIIITDDAASTEDYLMSSNTGGAAFTNMDNITLVDGNYDSIWMRDYAGNPVYGNEVDSLIMVDWMYNRPRPNDDASPEIIANELGLALYATTDAPYNLRYTGGNYMSDGFGTAFASELILEENDGDGDFSITYPNHNETEIDNILEDFMGIHTYIKMPTLPFDGIHHIDMHMKLIDEETLLVGEYPEDIADGPQINANIEYVLSNYESKFGTPYKVVRIPMPNSQSGLYPDNGGSYRTYTNAVFVNNTIIFPTYREQYDTIAYRIWGEICPGYTLVGIDCDNQGNNIISQSGAIHCITHTIGVEDPLLISHQPLNDTYDNLNPYIVSAYMNHRDGIGSGRLFWKTSTQTAFTEATMELISNNNWQANIPAQAIGTIIHYYVEGEATTGKIQTRPMPAPDAFWTFKVLGTISSIDEISTSTFSKIYPNPANAITCIEINNLISQNGNIALIDMMGKKVQDIHSGNLKTGINKFFFDAASLEAGVYHLLLQTDSGVDTQQLIVK
jgi:agmatine deiminase